MKRIRVTVKGGKYQVETTGYSGTTCQDATERLEKRLGVTLKDEPTAEMYEEQEVTHERAD